MFKDRKNSIIPAYLLYLCKQPAACSAASALRGRKVGTTQSAILPNGKACHRASGDLTASAAENNRPPAGG